MIPISTCSTSRDDEDEAVDDRPRRISRMSLALLIMMLANGLALVALRRQQQQQQHMPVHRSLQQGQVQEQQDDERYYLWNVRILVAIAAYDFSQLPHLEQVLEGYHDMCVAGATVKVVIHTTVAWPVPLMDLLETRFFCRDFGVDLVLKLPRIKLHLVDCHRQLFYSHLKDYDVFIYTEDDQRVTPRTVATYLQQTRHLEQLLQNQNKYKASDFNVGVVRYEYNFPSNVVMDDATRKATENVTRVYWEHSSFKPPLIPNAVDQVPQEPLHDNYVHMKNHHQGMFLATPTLLQEWKERCQFHVASNRPGLKRAPSQPLYGTQRVWMSSQQLLGHGEYGCGVQQVLPVDHFGALTIHHLPNKNYRRVGQYRTRDTNRNQDVVVEHESYLTALKLHLALVRHFAATMVKKPIRFTMTVDPEINPARYPPEWKPALDALDAYVKRGGIMNEQDMQQAMT